METTEKAEKAELPAFLKIIGANKSEIIDSCIKYIESEGYSVERCGAEWEKQNSICKRLNISGKKFRRRLKRCKHLDPRDVQRGSFGRLILIRSNPHLDRFLSAPAGAENNITVVEDDKRSKAITLPEGKEVKVKSGIVIHGENPKKLFSKFKPNANLAMWHKKNTTTISEIFVEIDNQKKRLKLISEKVKKRRGE